MTDAAIAEHIIYLVTKHTEYLDTINKQYQKALENHMEQMQYYLMSSSEGIPPELPKEPVLHAELCHYLLNRITATLENRGCNELTN